MTPKRFLEEILSTGEKKESGARLQFFSADERKSPYCSSDRRHSERNFLIVLHLEIFYPFSRTQSR
jgi:hypothetical protein